MVKTHNPILTYAGRVSAGNIQPKQPVYLVTEKNHDFAGQVWRGFIASLLPLSLVAVSFVAILAMLIS